MGAKLVLCGRNREALEELTKELASLATKVRPEVCFPWARGSVHPLQASEEIVATPGPPHVQGIHMVTLHQRRRQVSIA